jgi:PAS domain S-box-containing protein
MESEVKLQVATNAAKLGIYTYIIDGTLEWDFRVRELWGVDPDEVITYETFISGLHPHDIIPTQKLVDEALDPDGSGEYYAEYRVINKKDKNTYWIAATGKTFFEDKRPVRLIGSVQDISKQKQVEEALSESREKYKSFVEAAQEGIWVIDKNLKTTFVNPKLTEMLGYDPHELDGKSPLELMQQEYAVKSEEMLQEHIQGKNQVRDIVFLKKDGSLLWCILSSKPLFDEEGNFNGSIALLTDITRRKKAEESLRLSERRYRELHEGLRDAFLEGDLLGNIIGFNHVFCELIGYDPQELLSMHYKQITPDKWHKKEEEILSNYVLTRGYSDIYEKEYIRKDGTVIQVEIRVMLTRDNLGKPISYWAIVRDITERVKTQEILKEYASSLKELNEQKDKLFNIIAHDLKNPFSVLIGSSELADKMLESNNLEAVKRLLSAIRTSAINGYNLLDNLLEWARTQTGSTPINPQTINIKELALDILNNFQHFAQNKKVELREEVPENLLIMADKSIVSTVIRNLVENAIKFTKPEGTVTILATQTEHQTTITIKDTGIGINPEDKEKLFRLDIVFTRPGTNREKGTGLGLILCKELVQKHGGYLTIDSIPNVGTEISFTLNK